MDYHLMDDLDDSSDDVIVKSDYVEDINAFQNYIEAKVKTFITINSCYI
jgi:hypothetical protein